MPPMMAFLQRMDDSGYHEGKIIWVRIYQNGTNLNFAKRKSTPSTFTCKTKKAPISDHIQRPNVTKPSNISIKTFSVSVNSVSKQNDGALIL